MTDGEQTDKRTGSQRRTLAAGRQRHTLANRQTERHTLSDRQTKERETERPPETEKYINVAYRQT